MEKYLLQVKQFGEFKLTLKENEGDWVSRYDEAKKVRCSFHVPPQYTYINKVVTDYTARPLLHEIFHEGKLVYQEPTLKRNERVCSK